MIKLSPRQSGDFQHQDDLDVEGFLNAMQRQSLKAKRHTRTLRDEYLIDFERQEPIRRNRHPRRWDDDSA